MHYVALFSHAFKHWDGGRPTHYRTAYRIYNTASQSFEVGHLGPVLPYSATSSNAPQMLAAYESLTDPCLDRILRRDTVLVILTIHKTIHDKIQSFILRGSTRHSNESKAAFQKITDKTLALIDRGRTVSGHNSEKDTTNKVRYILNNLKNQGFTNRAPQSFEKEPVNPYYAKAIIDSCDYHRSRLEEHFMRFNR